MVKDYTGTDFLYRARLAAREAAKEKTDMCLFGKLEAKDILESVHALYGPFMDWCEKGDGKPTLRKARAFLNQTGVREQVDKLTSTGLVSAPIASQLAADAISKEMLDLAGNDVELSKDIEEGGL